eukprot:1026169-Pelagomonas_calceolata.AAC.1
MKRRVDCNTGVHLEKSRDSLWTLLKKPPSRQWPAEALKPPLPGASLPCLHCQGAAHSRSCSPPPA